jgi:hypothetical protein
MEKVVWSFMEPVIRERLIDKYVPKEPIDPLVYKITAFYWLLQELIGNWKSGKRLTLDQKAQLIELIVWNFSRVQQEQSEYEFDVTLCDTDINISQETTEQIAQLVLACKEFDLKVSD